MKPHIYMKYRGWWISRPGKPVVGPYYYWPMVLDVAALMALGADPA